MIATLRRAVTGTLAAAAVLTAVTAAQAAPLEFTLVNDSEFTLFTLFVSPDYSDTWGENVLADAMRPGEEVDFTSDGSHCIFDIQAGNRYGDVVEFMGVDLCRPVVITVE